MVLLNLTGLQGWVNDIAINGNEEMAIVLQNNNIAIKKIGDGDNNNNFVTARWNGLPLISVVWLNDNSFLASGYENRVGLFTRKGKIGLRQVTHSNSPDISRPIYWILPSLSIRNRRQVP